MPTKSLNRRKKTTPPADWPTVLLKCSLAFAMLFLMFLAWFLNGANCGYGLPTEARESEMRVVGFRSEYVVLSDARGRQYEVAGVEFESDLTVGDIVGIRIAR